MRSLIPTALLVALTAASCRAKPAPPVAPSVAAAAPASAPSRPASCGVVAHLDLGALGAIAGGSMVDDLWDAMLPRDLAAPGEHAIARSTRAATLCSDIGAEHSRQRAFMLEGDYPPDLLDRLVANRPGFVRQGRAAYASARLTVGQPDDHHLVVAPVDVGDSWVSAVDARGSRDSVLSLSLVGSALQDLLDGSAGMHAKQMDGVSAVHIDLATAGGLTVRISSSDTVAAAHLKDAVSELAEEMRKGAAQTERSLPAIEVRVDGTDVVVSVAIRPAEIAKTIRVVTDRIVARRPAVAQLMRRQQEGR
jgi:hypothetical protein